MRRRCFEVVNEPTARGFIGALTGVENKRDG